MRVLSILESVVAVLLVVAAAAFVANSQWCYFNHASCGMVEPIVAAYAIALAIPFALAAWLHSKRRAISGTVALLPALAIVLALIGQAQSWW
jgi:hypothetical protein